MYTVQEVAEQFRVNEKLIYRLVKSGKLQSYRIEGVIRITQEAVDRYLRNISRVSKYED